MVKPYVFLSYSHNDYETVKIIADKLKVNGLEIWFDDRELYKRSHLNYNAEIDNAIEDCYVFISFFSNTYVQKPYCAHELTLATRNHIGAIIAVCLDNVTEDNVDKNKRYFFHITAGGAGKSLIGYGKGIQDIDECVNKLVANELIDWLLQAYVSGDYSNKPKSYSLLSKLKNHHKQVQEAMGDISPTLFPVIKSENGVLFYSEGQNVALCSYCKQNGYDNIMLIGDGGIGKTISLIRTCNYLLQQDVYAIYIPVRDIDFLNYNLAMYIEKHVFGERSFWNILESLMYSDTSDKASRVVLLIDGINEAPLEHINHLIINQIIHSPYKNVNFILTSRFDYKDYFGNSNFVYLNMLPLNDDAIEKYLSTEYDSLHIDKNVKTILRTPLLLKLYTDVETKKVQYLDIDGLDLVENPTTPGHILNNFFQTQIYRVPANSGFNRAEYLVLIEFLLPIVAYKMVATGRMCISDDDFFDCIDEIQENGQLFQWYQKDRLRHIRISRNGKFDQSQAQYRLPYIVEDVLHFLCFEQSERYFSHQVFRDFFVACHIVNEMNTLKKDVHRKELISEKLSLEAMCFSDEILSYVADLTRESNRTPFLKEDGWHFPNKDQNMKYIAYPSAEKLLDCWRGLEGKHAQIAIYNLINIMKVGRNKNLSNCDFSNLDLRLCQMNGTHFVEWYKESVYPSTFDHSWINRSFFINDGHDAVISSVCTDEEFLIFSGDKNGYVRAYNIEEQKWVMKKKFHDDTVVDMAWERLNRRLVILYADCIFVYDFHKKTINKYDNKYRFKSYRYALCTNQGEIYISYDIEPLQWYNLSGKRISSDLLYDVPARCATWNPQYKMVVRSYLLQLLSVDRFDENDKIWRRHPSLEIKKKQYIENESLSGETVDYISAHIKSYIELRDFGADKNSSINCLCFQSDGLKFLVAVGFFLMEFDTIELSLLQKKKFAAKIRSCCYGTNNTIVVGAGSALCILNDDMTEKHIIKGSQIEPLKSFTMSPCKKGYYLHSRNGEIKFIDCNFIIRRIRSLFGKSKFIWVRDKLTRETQMAFLPSDEYSNGSRYTYATDQSEPLGWRYEALETSSSVDDVCAIYNLGTDILIVDKSKNEYESKKTISNYRGVWIFDCSFIDIHGNLSEPDNLQFLIQNGGIIHE